MSFIEGDTRLAIEDARYEMKFNTSAARCQDVLHFVNSDQALFRRAYPTRWVNSLYFDTWDLDAFQQNLSGVSSRTKVRLRWYGNLESVVAGVFEVKIKRNRLGWKLQQPLFFDSPILGMPFASMSSALRKSLAPNLALHAAHSTFGVQLGRYKRDYFISASGNIRVTVDSEIANWDQRYKARLSSSSRVIVPRISVLEFKAASEHGSELEAVVGRTPFTRSRHSKYMTGLMSALAF